MKKYSFAFAISLLLWLLTHYAMVAQQPLPYWTLGPFEKNIQNPLLIPDSNLVFQCPMTQKQVRWAANHVFNPAAALTPSGQMAVLFRAEDKSGATIIGGYTSRIGYAESADGLHFKANKQPVLFPARDKNKQWEWDGGCEDPRVVATPEGGYVMLYTMWNRDRARLGVATSRDLKHWKKRGPAFARAYKGKFKNDWSKSASIVCALKGNRLVAEKIKGRYLMYWGETFVNVATSDDLIHWVPEVNADGTLHHAMQPRTGFFDSHLVECGPPALVTSAGIVLIYNGKNHSDPALASKDYPRNVYAGGQALFDIENPSKLLVRLDQPFIRPTDRAEFDGQYMDGTNFLEGLVPFQGRWFLYYGISDSKIGVATAPLQKEAIALFNGRDLSGWQSDVPDKDTNPQITPSFVVRNGLLVSKGEPRGHLITEKTWQDYRLEVTYRFTGAPGNCGVLVHASTPRALYKMFPQSMEVQMQHGDAGDFWCIVEDITVPEMEARRGPKANWGITEGKERRVKNLTDGSEKPLGEWNTMVIECKKDTVSVWVNGDMVNQGTGCTAQKGKIALQAEGAEVEFKNVVLTPMKKD